MKKIRIPGSYDPLQSQADKEALKTTTLKIKEVKSYRIEAVRGGEAGEQITPAPGDIIEMELEDGFRLWVRAEEIDSYFPQARGRGSDDEAIEITPTISCGTESRGTIGKLVLKALRLIKIDPAKGAAEKIAKMLENKFASNGRGLFRLQPVPFRLQACGTVPTDRPILLFIHGTFSSTEGSFGDLWDAQRANERETLFKTYVDYVYGFEHPTLTEDPFTNACALVDALPAGARLHVVSQSRGGLVGELLCRGFLADGKNPFTKEDRDLLEGWNDQKAQFDKLNRLLKTKNIRVERFVRVACPTRGTTLASQRIDRWLSIVVNLLGKIPAFKSSGVYDVLTEFLLAVVKEHTDPATFPGLAAMMPDSPCVALLNRPGVTVLGDLRVIAGDIEETGIWGKLKLLLTDWFYGGEHDLVVNTASMWGGANRQERRERFSFHQGPNVTHFRYFANTESVQKLIAALTAKEGADDGFEPLIQRPTEPIPRSVRKGTPKGTRPIVFVLPGIMGSHLAVEDDRVWLDPLDLATGGFAKLAIDARGVRAESPVRNYYGDLIDYLAQTHEVRPFPFDWRRPIAEEARRLGDEIVAALDQAERDGQPVRIIAHSMGGIVVRTMIAERPDVWKRMCAHQASRFIMLGTPNGGAFATVQTLLAREPYIRYLAKLDLKKGHDTRFLLGIIGGFPGLMSLLPQTRDCKYLDQATWTNLHKSDTSSKDWVPPAQKSLAVAQETWKLLEKSPVDPERMIYVAGKAAATPCDLEVKKNTDGTQTIQFVATPKGDGRVPWDTGILKGLKKVWYMDVEHGDLSCYEPAFDAIQELLEYGTTKRLATEPPVSRGVSDRFPLEQEMTLLYPDHHDLEAAALGASLSRRVHRRSKAQDMLRVTVTHGNMAYTAAAVAVGHYQDDVIVSAEAYLDRILNGRLRDRYRLGVYPGAYDTCEVFLNLDKQPGGAIIIGLGAVGSLTAGKLEDAFAHAALKYAMSLAEARAKDKSSDGSTKIAACIASVLIGTGGHALPVTEAVTAIVRGVLKANDALHANGYADRVIFDKLELIEIYEDRAIQAMRSLHLLGQDPNLRNRILPDNMMRILDSGLRRASYEEDPGWWHRIQITETDQCEIKYVVLTNRARADGQLQPTQRPLIDALVEQAATSNGDAKGLGNTLFELLIPNELKDATPEMNNVMFVVDKATARYPWELMRDRITMQNEPLVVRAKFIRQYSTERYRRQVKMTGKFTALVIGDPHSTKYPLLSGAQAEARKVGRRLQDAGFEAPCLIQSDYRGILDELFARDYRILHLAAHGVYEHEVQNGFDKEGRPRRLLITGMVLGDDKFLTPAEINQMRVVPELVFINCCLLGKVDQAELRGDRSALAANLATQLIEMGVRVVVAAGWEVDDDAALCFADVFYAQMLAGHTFSEALLSARKETFYKTKTNTWGAYQAYGDPDYTLHGGEGVSQKTQEPETYFAQAQPILALKNIAAEAKNADTPQKEQLKLSVDDIAKRLPPQWFDLADVRTAMGEAYGELKFFADAVVHYRAALNCPSGNMPMRAVEQLCNLQVRLARQEATANPKKAVEDIENAKHRLETLNALSPSSERFNLLGSASKRLAMLKSGKARMASLEDMTCAYKEAARHALSTTMRIDPYAIQNWITGEVLLRLIDPGKKRVACGTLTTELKKAQEAARQQHQDKPDFWNLIIPVDCELLSHIVAMDLTNYADALADTYRKCAKQAGSPRELDSVIEQIKFLIEILEEKKADKQVAGVTQGLAALLKALDEGQGKIPDKGLTKGPVKARARRK
jgi:pimeloyl-ACP methyl ester carboxylesterase